MPSSKQVSTLSASDSEPEPVVVQHGGDKDKKIKDSGKRRREPSPEIVASTSKGRSKTQAPCLSSSDSEPEPMVVVHEKKNKDSAKRHRETTPKAVASTSKGSQRTSADGGRKRVRIHPATPPAAPSVYDLFGTDSEEEEEQAVPPLKTGILQKAEKVKDLKTRSRKPSCAELGDTLTSPPPPPEPQATPTPSTSRCRPATTTRPLKTTARDLFGVDSEDEIDTCSPIGKKPINSYITRREANGIARQMFDAKPGSHFVELKVYKCEEIERVQPMNRWRHAIVAIKNRTNDDTEAWQALTRFISAVRKEFKNCPPTFINY